MNWIKKILDFFKSRKELREKNIENVLKEIPTEYEKEIKEKEEIFIEKKEKTQEKEEKYKKLNNFLEKHLTTLGWFLKKTKKEEVETEESILEKLRKENNIKSLNNYEEGKLTYQDKLYLQNKLNNLNKQESNYKNSYWIESITKKGETVKSKAEKRIADFLYENKINYIYERPTIIWNWINIKLDFFIPEKNIFIEYFWLPDLPEYKKTMDLKIQEYKDYGVDCIMLFPDDLKNENFKQKIIKKLK